MIKRILSVAIAGQLATLGLYSTSAQAAVKINPQGIGQVLIYPYYTVNNDINTLISVVNTTDKVKATNIRFYEGKNNRDTLNFHIYLAPYDVWTAALVATPSTISSYEGQPSAKLLTNDNTCTVPQNISESEFRPYGYRGGDGYDDPIDGNMSRVTEGHIQVFEMGNVEGDFAQYAIFSGNSPNNCFDLERLWFNNGSWATNPNEGLTSSNGIGGLYGSASLIDVAGGFDVSYNATAIQGYSTVLQHAEPGTILPHLNSGNSLESIVSTGTGYKNITWDKPFKAISAVLSANEIYGDFVNSTGIGANTEWAITFPTKQFYVDPLFAPSTTPIAPFSETINENGSCESAQIALYNRETENDMTQTKVDLCWGVNTIEYLQQTNSNDSAIFASKNVSKIVSSYDTGWTKLIFNQTATSEGSTLTGLPVTGFAIQRYVNANLSGGVLANYGGLFPFVSKQNIE
ncbi:MAG TPA: hypothetical protein ENJ44_04520 [Oceanospirillales bacterium]|nr:hypothetical protein [Oceanospirillales bacterium]